MNPQIGLQIHPDEIKADAAPPDADALEKDLYAAHMIIFDLSNRVLAIEAFAIRCASTINPVTRHLGREILEITSGKR